MASNGSTDAQAAIQTCPKHDEEEMDMYCKTCKKPLCHECVRENHVQHQWLPMRKLAKELRANAKRRESEVTSQLQSVSNGQEKVFQYLYADYERSRSQHMSVLESSRIAVQRITDEIFDNRKQEIENFFDDRKRRCHSSKQKLHQEVQKLKMFRDQLKNEATTLSSLDIIELYEEIDSVLLRLRDACHLPEECFDISEFREGKVVREAIEEMFCHLDILERKATDISVTPISSQVVGQGPVNSICAVSDTRGWVRCDRLCKLVDLRVEEIATSDTKTAVNNIDLSSDGRITFCNRKDKTVNCITESGEVEPLYSTKPLIPIYIRITNSGDHLVSLVDEESRVRETKSRRLVRRVTPSGEMIKEYDYDSDGRTPLFHTPTRTMEHCNGDLTVIDMAYDEKHRQVDSVVGLAFSGLVRFKYEGLDDRYKFNPVDMTCDMMGHTLITDCSSRSIHLIDAEGKFVKLLLTKDTLSYGPLTVALHNNRLWIGSYEDGNVSVYDYK